MGAGILRRSWIIIHRIGFALRGGGVVVDGGRDGKMAEVVTVEGSARSAEARAG